MDGIYIPQWRNKFKRLMIEFHHHKNSTSYNDRVIHNPDRSRPLFSLRTPPIDQDPDRLTSLNIDQEQFEGFSDIAEQDTDVETNSESNIDGNVVKKLHRGVSGTLRAYTSERAPSSSHPEGVPQHDCTCNVSASSHSGGDFKDCNNHQISCPVHPDLSHCLPPTEVMARLMEGGVNYIEVEEKPTKLQRFFKHFSHQFHFPRIHWNSSVPAPGNVIVPKEDMPVEPSDNSVLGPIEIIALSSATPGLDVHNAEFDPIKEHDKIFGQENHEIEEIPGANKSSSYARRCQKPLSSMMSLAKVDSETALEKKMQKKPESWKVVLNEVSLYAALLSTGARPLGYSKSELHLVADFTRSQHHEASSLRQRLFEEASTVRTTQNNENEDQDDVNILDMTSEVDISHKVKDMGYPLLERVNGDNQSINITTAQIHNLLKSEKLGSTELRDHSIDNDSQNECGGYGDVFLDYAYSEDEEGYLEDADTADDKAGRGQIGNHSQASVVLPLNLEHKTVTRLF